MNRTKRAARHWLKRAVATAGRRTLISEILVHQIAVAAVIGVLAFGGLWWATGVIVGDQVRAWTEPWARKLDELGAPLYVVDKAGKYARVEDYADEFAEITFVRLYSKAGEPIFTKLTDRGDAPSEALAPERLAALTLEQSTSQGYLFESAFHDQRIVRIAKPIWSSSVRSDGLLGFDSTPTLVERTLKGYVELGLDFNRYRGSDGRVGLTASAIGLTLLLLTLGSWLIYRRALLPLAALQAPLRRVAGGEGSFTVATSGHREISAITTAMRASECALEARDQRLADLMSRDELTGLPNKSAFHLLVEREMPVAAVSGRTSALLFANLDQFKYVNDSLTRAAGDRLLQLVADRIQMCLRPNDVVARLGGDEFALLLRDVSQKEAAAMCAELVALVQGDSFSHDGRPMNLRCSIGATMIRGTKVDSSKLFSRAEIACHIAKANGRNQFSFYNVASKDSAERAADAAWSQKIHEALKGDAFVLHYQPILDVRTGETPYHEVLLRMVGDDDELVSPATFLPAAARMGLTVDIDRWVMRQSLRSLTRLRAAGADARFTLNVSGGTLDRADFFDNLEAELETTRVPPDAIVIEITEQIAMRNIAAAAARMASLVERGCRFAIDDFGSGYCSYAYLKELPIGFVKIDGSFITHLADNDVDRRIVAGIADVAAAARCEVIAEHVRDHATLELLRELGVRYAQGYALGKPAAEVLPAAWPQPALAGRREPRRAVLRQRAARLAAHAR